MKYEIKNIYTGATIHQDEADSFSALVLAAIKAKISLQSANLRYADLRYADLQSANLRYADLRYADLQSADLRYADLRYADLQSANLRYADLRSANLRSANLQSANLQSANLRYADLRYADLQSANLRSADLRSANLRSANLQSANLQSANLQSAKNISELASAQNSIVPETGAFIGWKICAYRVIVQLQIPASAKRSNATGRKCRASSAKVLKIFGAKQAVSQHDSKFIYQVGKIVKPSGWTEDRFVECGEGIHFFLTRIEAENY